MRYIPEELARQEALRDPRVHVSWLRHNKASAAVVCATAVAADMLIESLVEDRKVASIQVHSYDPGNPLGFGPGAHPLVTFNYTRLTVLRKETP